MSRIMRVFYAYQERIFTPDLLKEILLQYKEEINAHRAQLKLSLSILSSSLACAVVWRGGNIIAPPTKAVSTSLTVSGNTYILISSTHRPALAHLSCQNTPAAAVMSMASRTRSAVRRVSVLRWPKATPKP